MEFIDQNIYFFISTILFSTGIITVLTKKNAVMMLIGVELMLNAANVNLVYFSRLDPFLLQGQFMTLFIMVVAAAEASVGLAIIVKLFEHLKTSDPDAAHSMKK
ncbi:MAG: NADH-quinone oxidoreductase subunit NuoK [Cytophagaceae bacterium]